MIKSVKGFNHPPKDFYVYTHRRLTDMEIFYVGKGSGNRAWSLSRKANEGKNSHWVNVAKKHGVYIDIVQDGLQEWAALEIEADLIAYHGRSDCNLGTLVNKSDGGESGGGVIITETYLKKLRISGIKLGNPVVVDNNICFLTIKDAARYLSALHNTPFPTAAASVSNCIHKRAKRYKDHVICAPHEDYDTVAQNTKPRIKKVAPRVKGTFEIIKHLNLKSLSDYYIQHGVLATMSKFNLSKTHMYRCIHRYDSVADFCSVEVRKLKEK